MPLGLTEFSGTIAPADRRDQGEYEWQTVSGLSPSHPMVGGPDVAGLGAFDVDRRGALTSRVATLPAEDGGGAAAPWTGAGLDIPGVELIDDWRDLLNFRGSPMPWLLLLSLAALGVMSLSINGRLGPAKASASVG